MYLRAGTPVISKVELYSIIIITITHPHFGKDITARICLSSLSLPALPLTDLVVKDLGDVCIEARVGLG